eukprot:TRINITY_DN13507_c0_g1_i1.p1 TRINITY_DN13507_c0_g1~~TRINITY_DN13507_c0_g1_i1.p1  ORF type:complete len:139 (-),score=21.84 TRINITY_DN13507_c0_g1_i1:37-453(-)
MANASSFNWEQYANKVLSGGGQRVWQIAILDIDERSEILSKEVILYQDEVEYLIDASVSKTLHKKMISFGYDEYVVTSIQGSSFYARSVDTEKAPGGMCIIQTRKFLLVCTYKENRNGGFAGRTIPYVISMAQEIVNL